MAEEKESKTEAATAKRRRKNIEKGSVARSQDLTASLMLFAVVYLGFLLLPLSLDNLRAYMTRALHASVSPATELGAAAREGGGAFLLLSAPFLIVTGLIGFASAAAQRRTLIFNPDKLTPDFNRLLPKAKLSEWMKPEKVMSIPAATIKLILIGWLAWTTFRSEWPLITSLGAYTPDAGLLLWGSVIGSLAKKLALLFLLIGLIDFAFQYWKTERDQRMSKHDIKEEHKEDDGSPLAKSRRRGEWKMMVQAALTKVPTADVVVVNPVHFAVALGYRPKHDAAPVVLAKGREYLARRIVSIARENEVPVVENVLIARALYRAVEVDHPVPPELFRAVAKIFAFIYRTQPQSRPAIH